jgi:hypothetical protein
MAMCSSSIERVARRPGRSSRYRTLRLRYVPSKPTQTVSSTRERSLAVATLEECRVAVEELARRLAGLEHRARRHARDRTVSCWLPDLDVTFHGRLHDGHLVDITTSPNRDQVPADLRLRLSSDDLIALVDGSLSVTEAWATGRLKIDASLRDLLRLRSMF